MDDTLSLVLFSGTDDKLTAAAVLAVGAAAMDRKVNVLLQYWALDAFRAGHVRKDHGAAPEAGPEGQALIARAAERGQTTHWADMFELAKGVGEVGIHACSLSMDVFDITAEDLDDLVDDVEGVAAFMAEATGPVVFV
ncbi:MAG TPA: DsrE/DsrF/DrsH-like family protein [Actinomycetota bacterium]|jgi:peroxiredoxin family protein|nr:DsrE/DsrF/DrsH-like family protein [Actinomycetota bacterium]